MSFQWPDPVSFVADIIAIIGIPTLAVSTSQLYRDAKKAREPQAVGHRCLEFNDVDQEVGINLIPLKEVTAIPRAGDVVILPGSMVDHQNYGGGVYSVQSIQFNYLPAEGEVNQPCPAVPSGIVIDVRKIEKTG